MYSTVNSSHFRHLPEMIFGIDTCPNERAVLSLRMTVASQILSFVGVGVYTGKWAKMTHPHDFFSRKRPQRCYFSLT
ncbi:hypothetical protein RvY_02254 [Ramazzottius varieornatus]|uniref:Uncharacterized protein n=1 Tax=Ramazzottius varieornatus TaxID=947166 RepID=A0A1D1UTN9_RAMVA|nr:hypothetical protein RvY_02254 [Ramazzottius varieornatus]